MLSRLVGQIMPVPSDIYKGDVDFTALALRYPDFAKKSVQKTG